MQNRSIFKTLAYLEPEEYSKPFEISKMLLQSHNSLFRRCQEYSGTFDNIQPCLDILRDIKLYRDIFRHY